MNYVWIGLGYSAIFLSYLKWVLQMIHAKKKGEALIPSIFWALTFAAIFLNMAYSFYIRDLVYIGQAVIAFLFNFYIFFANMNAKSPSK